MRKKILIFGNFGAVNFGDEIILQGLLTALQGKFAVTVASANPALTKDKHSVDTVLGLPFGFRSFCKSIFGGKIVQTLRAIAKADFVFFGGGGLFQDREKRAFPMWTFFLRICLLWRKRVFLVANSFENFKKQRSLNCAKKLFKKVEFFSVRDNFSKGLLQSLGVENSKINLATDCAFFLKSQPVEAERSGGLLILHGEKISAGQSKAIKNFVQESEMKFAFLPMQKNISCDHRLAKSLGTTCLNPSSVGEIFTLASQPKLILTIRLHGAIAAMLQGTPFLAFSKMGKMKHFLTKAGLGALLLPSEFQEHELKQRATWVLANTGKVQEMIAESCLQERALTGKILPSRTFASL